MSSARLLLYGSSIAGVQAKIVEIVPEGRSVAPGDVLVVFDATTFQQNLLREEAALRQAEAEHLRAREELRIERLRLEADRRSSLVFRRLEWIVPAVREHLRFDDPREEIAEALP